MTTLQLVQKASFVINPMLRPQKGGPIFTWENDKTKLGYGGSPNKSLY